MASNYLPGRVRGLDNGMVVYGAVPNIGYMYDSHQAPSQPPQYEPYHDEWISLPDPAAGAPPATHIVAGTQWEMPLVIRGRIVTSAAVANRVPILAFGQHLNTANFLLEVQQPSNVTATQNIRFNWSHGLSPAGGVLGNVMGMSLPEIYQAPGNYWAIQINAIDVADQISQVQALIRCWPNRPSFAA